MLQGWTGQGYDTGELSLFDPSSDDIHDLTGGGISIHSDNDGACIDQSSKCWNITGKWHFASNENHSMYDDLLIEFSGELSKAQAQQGASSVRGSKRVTSKANTSARYVFDGKQYKLIEGENIVPGV